MGFREENHIVKGPFSSHLLKRTCSQHDITDDVTLITWPIMFASFLHREGCFPLFHLVLPGKEVTVISPHSRSGELRLHLPKGGVFYSYLSIYISIDSWVFALCCGSQLNTTSLFVAQIPPALPAGALSSGLPCPSMYRSKLMVLYSSHPSPRLSHFSKDPWFLLLENK